MLALFQVLVPLPLLLPFSLLSVVLGSQLLLLRLDLGLVLSRLAPALGDQLVQVALAHQSDRVVRVVVHHVVLVLLPQAVNLLARAAGAAQAVVHQPPVAVHRLPRIQRLVVPPHLQQAFVRLRGEERLNFLRLLQERATRINFLHVFDFSNSFNVRRRRYHFSF